MKPPLAGIHGLAISCRDPKALARALARRLGVTTVRSTRTEVIVGAGPELFIALRERDVEGVRLEEVHVAVTVLGASSSGARDALGGDSVSDDLPSGLSLTLRQFRRPPSPPWRRRRS